MLIYILFAIACVLCVVLPFLAYKGGYNTGYSRGVRDGRIYLRKESKNKKTIEKQEPIWTDKDTVTVVGKRENNDWKY